MPGHFGIFENCKLINLLESAPLQHFHQIDNESEQSTMDFRLRSSSDSLDLPGALVNNQIFCGYAIFLAECGT